MLSFFNNLLMPVSFTMIKKSFFNSLLPAITWWVITLVLMCTPGRDFPSLGSWTELISLDKLIHIFIFGLMAYLFSRAAASWNVSKAYKKQLFIKIAMACATWGLTIEFIQHYFIPGRSLDFYDFIADAAGCFFAYLYSNRYLIR